MTARQTRTGPRLHLWNEAKKGPHCSQPRGVYDAIPTTEDMSKVTCSRCKLTILGRPFKRKITDEQIAKIHQMRQDRFGYKEIAYEIGCSISTVERYLKGEK